ncbi:hypothetical protein [Actinomadura madurae]|uniref:hypothetical protein n=1 Tax=Actinomadura madurae TaxID=1993 RepID=UPI00202734E4|nr:hypothetical protein [Actinomadura madurae]MCP9949591.1 hypothetical protein [Actinomadura madurae]MCP9966346.1 hypothetical protein [Actinomadura madurae]MCP9978836.1 hypothetical protein [Actinomadura madurae]MCQ0009636.1 hypothetical protein [Actinomadura madurae]URM95163.1 hypothetical protein LUW76_13025 [Actinomadura madurae]
MELHQVPAGQDDQGWAPQACTLPTAERPLRVAGRAAELAARETGCCSFFTFTLTATGGELTLDVSAGDRHAGVLDALTSRATRMSAASPGARP